MPGKLLVVLLLCSMVAGSCYRKITCPAYQSKYLFDEKAFNDQFSLFNPDSTPRNEIGYVKKNKFGIHVEKPYWRRNIEIKTIPMVKLYPVREDSIDMYSSDTIPSDSAYHLYASRFMTVVNYDQLMYNYLYGNLFFEVQEKQEEGKMEEVKNNATGVPADTVKTRKTRLNIFRKKETSGKDVEVEEDTNPPENTTPDTLPPPQEEDDGF